MFDTIKTYLNVLIKTGVKCLKPTLKFRAPGIFEFLQFYNRCMKFNIVFLKIDSKLDIL